MNSIDTQFNEMMDKVESLGIDGLVDRMVASLYALPIDSQKQILSYFYPGHLWGQLDPRNGELELFNLRALALYNHRSDFIWLFNRLEDYRSKYAFIACVDNFMNFYTPKSLSRARETLFPEYWDPDVFNFTNDEVIVDCGAYTGDSFFNYAAMMHSYKRYYCYEVHPQILLKLKDNVKNSPNVVVCNKGVSDKNGKSHISLNRKVGSTAVGDKGNFEINCVALDHDIAEPITFLKMDIEGAEQSAIMGAAIHIRNDRPKLGISIYHSAEDIWKIPRMIDEISPGYKFFLRFNGGTTFLDELSLYATY